MIRPKCGTYAGVTAHFKAGETTCPECQAARREYMRTYRQKQGPEAKRKTAEQRAAHNRALIDLSKLHPEQYQALLAKHTRKATP